MDLKALFDRYYPGDDPEHEQLWSLLTAWQIPALFEELLLPHLPPVTQVPVQADLTQAVTLLIRRINAGPVGQQTDPDQKKHLQKAIAGLARLLLTELEETHPHFGVIHKALNDATHKAGKAYQYNREEILELLSFGAFGNQPEVPATAIFIDSPALEPAPARLEWSHTQEALSRLAEQLAAKGWIGSAQALVQALSADEIPPPVVWLGSADHFAWLVYRLGAPDHSLSEKPWIRASQGKGYQAAACRLFVDRNHSPIKGLAKRINGLNGDTGAKKWIVTDIEDLIKALL